MIIVRLNDWTEFLGELRAHAPQERVVRLTVSVRYDARGVAHLTMVAGYLNGDSIVEFVHYLGVKSNDQANNDRAQAVQTLIANRKRDLEAEHFAVKPGRYHVPPTTNR